MNASPLFSAKNSASKAAYSGPVDWRRLAKWLLADGVISESEHQRIVKRCSLVDSNQHALLRLAQLDVKRASDGTTLDIANSGQALWPALYAH